ncbi:hypothetical protein DFH94DRAFT_810833 [Russula ochroleuca]|uniref:Uncharacterized protein n=1 Tax=Russula ochroleuca TaxID=152965 RepID=A0A9P5JYL1_9AGAM|nr:hypothetical protein DFH94DRAFT_810833 [Russula ochroleuca]
MLRADSESIVVKSSSLPHRLPAIYGVPHNITPRDSRDVDVVLILLTSDVLQSLSPVYLKSFRITRRLSLLIGSAFGYLTVGPVGDDAAPPPPSKKEYWDPSLNLVDETPAKSAVRAQPRGRRQNRSTGLYHQGHRLRALVTVQL